MLFLLLRGLRDRSGMCGRRGLAGRSTQCGVRCTDRRGQGLDRRHPGLSADARNGYGSYGARLVGENGRIRHVGLVGALAFAVGFGCAQAHPIPVSTAATTQPPSKSTLSSSAAHRIIAADSAFQRSLRDIPALSLSRRDIRMYQKRREEIDKVVRSGDGHLSYSLIPVNTNPGAQAPIINMTTGTVSAISFVDSTGAPWPITSETVGNARWFHIAIPKGLKQGNLLVATPLVRVGISNVLVTLKGRDAPVTLVLRSRPRRTLLPSVINVLVPGLGPKAHPPTLLPAGPQTVTAHQIAFLDGVPPSGAKPLTLSPGAPAQMWRYQKHLYLRCRASLIFPAWTSVVRGSRHMRVYTLMPTPVLLLMRHGRQIHVAVTGGDVHG